MNFESLKSCISPLRKFGLLLALGIAVFDSNALAELPNPGEYKGTLTFYRSIEDRDFVGPVMKQKVTYKATARLDAEGFLRVLFASNGAPPLFGKLVVTSEEFATALLNSNQGTFDATINARTIEFGTAFIEGLNGPDGQQVTLNTEIKTKLVRVGK